MDVQPMSVDHDDSSVTYRGTSLSQIPSLINQTIDLIDMQNVNKENHSFLIKPFKYDPSNDDCKPEAENGRTDFWDDDHVRMPCSPSNVTKQGHALWPHIQNILIELKQKCEANKAKLSDLKEAIEKCNGTNFNIGSLEYLLRKVYSKEEKKYFLFVTLPKMISLVINIENICGQTPRKLRINSNHSLTLSQQQAAALLSCAFFCLYPSDDSYNHTSQGYALGQSINFTRLLQFSTPWKVEKLKCILHYFRRVTDDISKGVLTFRRSVLVDDMKPDWFASDTELCDVHFDSRGIIEDMQGLLQVDFANMYIGGGVMDEGRVQEEIRFTICPEMLVSILVCEVMQDNECIFLIGCEQFTTYDGYCDTFVMKDSFHDQTKKDSWGRKLCHVVAIDATYFPNPKSQYTMKSMTRELTKAYVGFHLPETLEYLNYGIATGNWGCGAFNGDLQLKAIIQLITSSLVKRPLVYLTFNNETLVESFWQVYKYLKENQATVRNLCTYLRDYSSDRKNLSLFEFILTRPLQIITDV